MVRRRNWLSGDPATQWWPAMERPAGTANWPQAPTLDNQSRASSFRTERDVAITRQKLLAAVFAEATPCVLEIQVQEERNTLDNYLKQSTDYPAKSVEAAGIAGQLILEYGSGGVVETVVMDLKNGSFQLPPCVEVRAFVSTSIDDVGTDLPPIQIAGSLVPGIHPAPAEPTFTVQHGTLTTSGYETQVPDRARFVDLWLPSSGNTLKYGTGAPILFATGDKIFPQIVRDYTTGIYAPPYRSAMAIQSSNAEAGVTIDTTVACEAVLQFVLEL